MDIIKTLLARVLVADSLAFLEAQNVLPMRSKYDARLLLGRGYRATTYYN